MTKKHTYKQTNSGDINTKPVDGCLLVLILKAQTKK